MTADRPDDTFDAALKRLQDQLDDDDFPDDSDTPAPHVSRVVRRVPAVDCTTPESARLLEAIDFYSDPAPEDKTVDFRMWGRDDWLADDDGTPLRVNRWLAWLLLMAVMAGGLAGVWWLARN